MSTLKVATIQDTSGNNSSTPNEVAQGRAKAWVNFNGTGTVAIRDSFNVSSIADNGTGLYTINFTNAFADTNYCPVMWNNADSSEVYTSFNADWSGGMTLGTSTLKVSSYAATAFADSALFFVAVFGD